MYTESQRQYYENNKEKLQARALQYYYSHREERLRKVKEYKRLHRVNQRGKPTVYGVNKPPYPLNNCCPYCDKTVRLLTYHHWDDSDYGDGIWLCILCHSGLERLIKSMPHLRRELIHSLKSCLAPLAT